jgi:hypothetical protein
MPVMDPITEQNDLYVSGTLDAVPGAKKQETDTHFRAKKGKGHFNWRMKWDVELSSRTKIYPRFKFSVWDLDLALYNDAICEGNLNLKGLCKKALKNNAHVKLCHKRKPRFQISSLRQTREENRDKKSSVELSVELVPKELALQLPAGLGRSEPNCNPHLPKPEGRVNWSLFHPLDMLKEILGPKLYAKLWMFICCGMCITLLVFMVPMIASNVVSAPFTGRR